MRIMDEQEQTEGFKVTDKRRFSSEGETRGEDEAQPDSAQEQPVETATDSGAAERSKQEDEKAAPPPSLDFATFILSLANTALFQLGLVRAGEQGEPQKDLQGARQTIDLIALMEEKTRGNLTEQESAVLSETLYQLRMAFVEASKSE
jgi:hypothetical protein